MNILSERAAISRYCGMDDLNAEVVVNDNGKTVYINVHDKAFANDLIKRGLKRTHLNISEHVMNF